jgi:hypothetical protein
MSTIVLVKLKDFRDQHLPAEKIISLQARSYLHAKPDLSRDAPHPEKKGSSTLPQFYLVGLQGLEPWTR